jgi:hypothetical protein
MFSSRYPYPYQNSIKLESFSRHNFEKFSNIKFHENSSSESEVVACGQA